MRLIAGVCGLVALSACGADAPGSADTAQVSDSAGIRIVELPVDLPADSIPIQVVWRHGDDADEYQFKRASAGTLAAGDAGIVGDGGNGEVIRIDGESSHSILARNGQGPEEVGSPLSIFAAADGSVFVHDRLNRKVLRFVGDSVTDVLTSDGPILSDMMPVGSDGDGTLLMITASYSSRFETPWLDGHVARFATAPFALDTVAAYPIAERSDRESPTAFGYGGQVAGGPAGLIQVRSDRAEVIWRNAQGDIETIARWSPDPAFVDEQVIEAFQVRMREDLIRVNPQLSREEAETFAADRVASYQFDPTRPLPVMRLAYMGQDGRAWVEEFAADGEPMRLRVLDRDGTPLGTVHLPFPIRFMDATRDHLLGIATGDLGVQSVVLFRIGP